MFPILCERDGTVCEPVTSYFGWCLRKRRMEISSMRDAAYILREWWSHLASTGRRWDEPDDQAMIDWREALKTGPEAAEPARIGRKLEVVFDFYYIVPEAMALATKFVSSIGPISCAAEADAAAQTGTAAVGGGKFRAGRNRRGANRWATYGLRRWDSAEPAARGTRRRPTPNDADVCKVLERLRSTSEEDWARDRDWLIGRVMSEAGLRRDEARRLSVRQLEEALALEGICDSSAGGAGKRAHGGAAWLDRLGEGEPRKRVLDALDRMGREKRANISVRIFGKGRVTRIVPFPLDLARDLLMFGVWTSRAARLKDRGVPADLRPDEVFLSEKTRGPLTPDAVTKIIKNAFKSSRVLGSGHRLRAHFATKYAERRWAELFSSNGFRWDQTMLC